MRSILLAVVVATTPGVAAGQTGAEPVTAEELRNEMFGVHLYGAELTLDYRFDECITPEGRTVYRVYGNEFVPPYSENGQLVITDDARACFSYPPEGDPEPACFTVQRDGDNLVFRSVDTQAVFYVDRIVRGKKRCPNPGDLIG